MEWLSEATRVLLIIISVESREQKGEEKNKSINVNVYGGKKGQYSLFFEKKE